MEDPLTRTFWSVLLAVLDVPQTEKAAKVCVVQPNSMQLVDLYGELPDVLSKPASRGRSVVEQL
jgi:hypothetical protein